jgi:hypothetical protein
LFSLIAGIKTNMLLIVFLGLIAKLTSVNSDCNVGTSEVYDFDWIKVGVIVMTRILEHSGLKTAD